MKHDKLSSTHQAVNAHTHAHARYYLSIAPTFFFFIFFFVACCEQNTHTHDQVIIARTRSTSDRKIDISKMGETLNYAADNEQKKHTFEIYLNKQRQWMWQASKQANQKRNLLVGVATVVPTKIHHEIQLKIISKYAYLNVPSQF